MGVFCLYVCLGTTCVPGTQRPEEGIGFSGNELQIRNSVTGVCPPIERTVSLVPRGGVFIGDGLEERRGRTGCTGLLGPGIVGGRVFLQ